MTMTVTSAVRAPDGTLTISGTEFTKTTSYVYIDDVAATFEWISAEEIKVPSVASDAIEARVEKNGVTAAADITQGDAPATTEPPAAGADPGAPTVLPELQLAGMDGAPKAIAPGTWPNPIDAFRTAVQGTTLVGLIPVGDEKTPYPTGTQLGSGKKFWLRNGFYLSATPT